MDRWSRITISSEALDNLKTILERLQKVIERTREQQLAQLAEIMKVRLEAEKTRKANRTKGTEDGGS